MVLRALIIVGVCLGSGFAVAQSEVVPTPAVEAMQVQSQVYHSGWGCIQSDGSLKGRVVTIGASGALQTQAGALVTLSRDLVVLSTTTADADGNFAFSGLSEGVYEIAAESPTCYAINSFQAVLAGRSGSESVMNVYASSMSRSSVDEVLKSLWAPQEFLAGSRPFQDLIAPLMPATQSQRVAILGGMVSGQVAFENSLNIPEAHVIKVFRNGSLIATAPVDSMGKFSFPASPGPVDLVLGGSAYASMGVELVDETRLASRPADGQAGRFVSAPAEALAAANSLVVPAAGGGAPPTQTSELPPPLAMAPPMGGGFGPMGGGGGGFGGGGGGGLGGLGGLLGIGGIALGAVALANNDDGFTTAIGTSVITIP